MLERGRRGGSCRCLAENFEQRLDAVVAVVDDSVDEQGGSPEYLTRRGPVLGVSPDALADRLAGSIALEARDIEAEVTPVAAQVIVLERLLAVEEQLVHL